MEATPKIYVTTYLQSSDSLIAEKAMSMGVSLEDAQRMYPELAETIAEWHPIGLDLMSVKEALGYFYTDSEDEESTYLITKVITDLGHEYIVDIDFDVFIQAWSNCKYGTTLVYQNSIDENKTDSNEQQSTIKVD
jgi:hypothetical protein